MIVVVCVLCLLSVCKLETFTTVVGHHKACYCPGVCVLSHPMCVCQHSVNRYLSHLQCSNNQPLTNCEALMV